MNKLDGYKTYFLSFAGVVAAAAGYWTGELTQVEAIMAALAACGFSTVRHGVKKDSTK